MDCCVVIMFYEDGTHSVVLLVYDIKALVNWLQSFDYYIYKLCEFDRLCTIYSSVILINH